MITTENVRELLKAAYAGSRHIRLTGYVTGEGAVYDYELHLLAEDGYKSLVQESLNQLRAGKCTRPAHIPQADWDLAVQEQIASWVKTINGQQIERDGVLYQLSSAGFSTRADKPELTVLRHMCKLYEKQRASAPNAKVVKSANKTLAKKSIAEQCPIGKYLGMLNLAPGKFENLVIL